jgi:hypothetical protein
MALYPKGQSNIAESAVDAVMIGDHKLAIISDTKEKVANYKPETSKTLTYYNGGITEFENKYSKGFEHVTDIVWNVKTNRVDFSGVNYSMWLPCAKHIGGKNSPFQGKFLKNDKRIKGYVMFDEQHNRLNLILTNELDKSSA